MKEEYFNQDYAHLTLGELEEDLKRCEEEHKNGNFMSDEIFNLNEEISKRKNIIMELLKQEGGNFIKEQFLFRIEVEGHSGNCTINKKEKALLEKEIKEILDRHAFKDIKISIFC